jgi:hypothetical protein
VFPPLVSLIISSAPGTPDRVLYSRESVNEMAKLTRLHDAEYNVPLLNCAINEREKGINQTQSHQLYTGENRARNNMGK